MSSHLLTPASNFKVRYNRILLNNQTISFLSSYNSTPCTIRGHEPFLDHSDMIFYKTIWYDVPGYMLTLTFGERLALNKLTAGWNTCPNRVIARLGHLCVLLFLHCNSMMVISLLILHYNNCRIASFPRLSISLMSYYLLTVEVFM
jgi:hypothetical protein